MAHARLASVDREAWGCTKVSSREGGGAAAWAALALVAGLFIAPAAAEERESADWLIYDDFTGAYEIDRDAGAPERHEIASLSGEKDRAHVILIVPKRDPVAYSVSINTILSTFADRGRPARFSLWHTAQDKAIACEALQFAEAEAADLIMTVGSSATTMIDALYRTSKPADPDCAVEKNLPVVTSASKDPFLMGLVESYDAPRQDENFAFTSINVQIETLMPMLRQVRPNLRNIWVLYARKNLSAVQTQVEPLKAYAAEPGQDLTIGEVVVDGGGSAVEDLKERMPKAVEEIKAIDPTLEHSIFWITGSSSVYNHIEVINAEAGGVPVLAALPNVVAPGTESAVLSIGVNQASAVHLAALYGLSVLGGTAPGDLPVGQVSPPDIAINFLKVREAGVKLPFTFFEDATFIYDDLGRLVRENGAPVAVN